MERRHGAGGDAAGEAVAHDELVAGAQRGDEGVEIGEIVAVVGVAHDDVLAAGRLDAAGEGRAVAADRDRDDAGAFGGRDRLAAVGRAVVGDERSRRRSRVRSRKERALRMQIASVSASLRQGMRMVSSMSAKLTISEANRGGFDAFISAGVKALSLWACPSARSAEPPGYAAVLFRREMRRGRDFGPGKAGRSGKAGVGLLRPAHRDRFFGDYPGRRSDPRRGTRRDGGPPHRPNPPRDVPSTSRAGEVMGIYHGFGGVCISRN